MRDDEDPCVHDRCVHTCADCGDVIDVESHDAAYQNGRADVEEETNEALEDKDVFIEGQALLIEALMQVLTEAKAWPLVPDDVYERLRDYV